MAGVFQHILSNFFYCTKPRCITLLILYKSINFAVPLLLTKKQGHSKVMHLSNTAGHGAVWPFAQHLHPMGKFICRMV